MDDLPPDPSGAYHTYWYGDHHTQCAELGVDGIGSPYLVPDEREFPFFRPRRELRNAMLAGIPVPRAIGRPLLNTALMETGENGQAK